MIVRSLAWMGTAQGISFLLQFAASLILARLLTPHQLGVYAIAFALTSALSVIQALGLQSLIVREELITKRLLVTAYSVNLSLACLLFSAILGTSLIGAYIWHDTGVGQVLRVLSLGPLIGSLEFLPAAVLEREARFKTMSFVTMASNATGTLFTIGLALLGFSYMSFAYAQIAALLISACLYNYVGRQHASFSLGLHEWRRVAGYGTQMLAVSGVNVIVKRLADLFLGRTLGLAALGLYSRATSLQALLWGNIYLVLGRVLLVDFAEKNRRGVSLRAPYMVMIESFTALLWPAFSGLAIVAGPFINTVYGPRWSPAARPLVCLCIGSMLQVSIAMAWEVFVAKGEISRQTRLESLKAVAFLPIFALGCFISIEAAAAARVAEGILSVLIYRKHLNRMTNTTTLDFLPVYLRSLLLTLVAVSPALIIMLMNHMSPNTPLIPLMCGSLLGLLLWFAGLLAFRHPLVSGLRNALRRRRNRQTKGHQEIASTEFAEGEVSTLPASIAPPL